MGRSILGVGKVLDGGGPALDGWTVVAGGRPR